jgi:hypothetical protein
MVGMDRTVELLLSLSVTSERNMTTRQFKKKHGDMAWFLLRKKVSAFFWSHVQEFRQVKTLLLVDQVAVDGIRLSGIVETLFGEHLRECTVVSFLPYPARNHFKLSVDNHAKNKRWPSCSYWQTSPFFNSLARLTIGK